MDNKSKPSDLGIDTQIKETMATPLTLLFALYRANLAIKLRGWKHLDLLKQCEYLQSENIKNKPKRKAIIDELIQDSNFTALKYKSYLRIRIKAVMAQFYRETQQLKSLTHISEWNGRHIMLSFISHLLSISTQVEHKKAAAYQKVWQFADFLRGYFRDTNYDSTTFVAAFNENKQSKNKVGFGLKIMRNVCLQFGLKCGPYSKVKKQCNLWAAKLDKELHELSGVGIQNIKTSVAQNTKNKYVSTVAQIINQESAATQHDNGTALNGKLWYWLCDASGLKWVPYRQDDELKLNTAWINKGKSAVIIGGSYRVEFDYRNSECPSGSQYNNGIANPNGRMIMCAMPQSTIHGIAVDTKPL